MSGFEDPGRTVSSASSVYEEHAARIEELGLMLGEERGRLALSLDLLTDALVVTGTHAVYCRLPGRPEAPSRDMETIASRIEQAKVLIQDAMRSRVIPRE